MCMLGAEGAETSKHICVMGAKGAQTLKKGMCFLAAEGAGMRELLCIWIPDAPKRSNKCVF